MSGTISTKVSGVFSFFCVVVGRANRGVCSLLFAALLQGMLSMVAFAHSSAGGWLYVLDPGVELRVWGEGAAKEYEIGLFGRSPGVPDELLDRFKGTLTLNSEQQWTDGGTLFVQGNPGDQTLRIKLSAQGRQNWSARKRNFYPGKDWSTLVRVPTGVLPAITGRYENAGESGPNFDEYLTLRETPRGVWFDLEFAMADEELVNQFASRVSEDTFLFRQATQEPGKKGELSKLEIRVLRTAEQGDSGAGPMAYKVALTADNLDELPFPWSHLEGRLYRKLAPGGISERAFRLHSKPLKPGFLSALEKIRIGDALSATDGERALAAYREASGQMGGGVGLAQALADRRRNGVSLRSAIRNAAAGVDCGLETLWFELGWADGDLYIDPAFVLRMYREAGVNPEERHAGQWELMQIAVESGPLDLNAFLREHQLKAEELRSSPYAIWELAREASTGGRFGKADARLALQLVLRGGGNIEEREAAIRQCHAILRGVRSGPFEPAECVRSRVGKAYLLSRTAAPGANVAELEASLTAKLGSDPLREAFLSAFGAVEKFAEEESRHYSGCRGFFAWEANRLAYKQSVVLEFLEDVGSVLAGKMPPAIATAADSEATLAELLQNRGSYMQGPKAEAVNDGQDPVPGDSFYFPKDVPKDGEADPLDAWKGYREAVTRLFYALKPERTESAWREWLNNRRIAFLLRFKGQAG